MVTPPVVWSNRRSPSGGACSRGGRRRVERSARAMTCRAENTSGGWWRSHPRRDRRGVMSKVRIGTLVVAVVLFSAVDPVRTYGQTNPSDTTLSNLTLRSTAGTRAGQQFKGLGGLIGAVITAPLQAAVSGDELPLSPAFQPDVQSYKATVPFNATSVKLSATTSHSGASAKAVGATADGTPLETGMSADGINLSLPDGQKVRVDILRTFRRLPVGSSTITIEVTSENGEASNAYSIVLLRSAPDLKDTDDRALYFRESLLAGKADSVSEAVEAGVDVNRQLEFGRQIRGQFANLPFRLCGGGAISGLFGNRSATMGSLWIGLAAIICGYCLQNAVSDGIMRSCRYRSPSETSPRKCATSSRLARRCNANPCRNSSAVSWNGSHPGPPWAPGCKEFAIARKRQTLRFHLPAF